MIRKGTRIKFIVIGRCVGLFTTLAGDLRAAVNDRLGARGWTVFSSNVIPASNERLGDWDYRSELTVASSVDHASIEDMIATVKGVFWEEAGSQPTVNAAGYTTQGQQPSPTPIIPDFGGLGNWFSGLSAGAIIALAGVALLVFYKRV